MAKKAWNQKSPGSVSGRGNQSPLASPAVSQQTTNASWWGEAQTTIPSMPSFGEMGGCLNTDPTGAHTPMGSHMQGSVFLPVEAMRHCQVPHMPGNYVHDPTMNAFGMPACMQAVNSPMACMHPVGSPMACMANQSGQTMQAMPQWYSNPGQFCGMPMPNGAMTPCTQMQGHVGNDGACSMHFGMMQSPQQHMAVPINMQHQNSFVMPQTMPAQGAPFPMPLSPPHDLAQSGFANSQPAYYEAGGMQLVNVPVSNCPQ